MPTESGSRGRWTDATALPALALFAFTFALNANALTAFFVGDDFDFLRGIEKLDSLWDTVAFSFWGVWEPVWWATWYIDFAAWGAQPLGYHLTNVAWYAIGVVSLFGVVRNAWPGAPFAAWAAALLFASHPVHDEAVTYLSARGHPMATGLALAALWAYAAVRGGANNVRYRSALWLAALGCAFLAALAKETALVLPAWAGALEFAVTQGSALRRLGRGCTTAALFAIPAAATLALRWIVVGLESDKLTGSLDAPGTFLASWFSQLPDYVLLAAVPLPLAFASKVQLASLAWVGWLIVGAASAGWIVVARWKAGSGTSWSTALQLWGVGWIVFAAALGPVLWADLPLRRRYALSPSVGAALIGCGLLYLLYVRAPRAARATLMILVVLGSAATWQRNVLYVGSGAFAENVLITLRGAPLDEPAVEGLEDVALLTLPRAYGGDSVSGAYLFHHTDLTSGLRFYDAPQRRIHYALKGYYAEDYVSEARFDGRNEIALTVSFRGRRAFDDARNRDAAEDRFGELLYAELESVEAEAKRLRYRVYLRPDFWERATLYALSDGALIRLTPPPPAGSEIDLSEF